MTKDELKAKEDAEYSAYLKQSQEDAEYQKYLDSTSKMPSKADVAEAISSQEPATESSEVSPVLSLQDRLIMSLASSPEKKAEYIRANVPGVKTKIKDGEVFAKNPVTNQWNPIRGDFFSSDIAGRTTELIPEVPLMVGQGIGTAVGAYFGGLPGASVGSGISAGAGEYAREKLGEKFGIPDNVSKGNIALSTALGVALPVVWEKAAVPIIQSAFKKATSYETANALKNSFIQKYPNAARYIEDLFSSQFKQKPTPEDPLVNADLYAYKAADALRGASSRIKKEQGLPQAKELERILEGKEVTVDTSKFLGIDPEIDKIIEQSQKRKAGLPTEEFYTNQFQREFPLTQKEPAEEIQQKLGAELFNTNQIQESLPLKVQSPFGEEQYLGMSREVPYVVDPSKFESTQIQESLPLKTYSEPSILDYSSKDVPFQSKQVQQSLPIEPVLSENEFKIPANTANELKRILQSKAKYQKGSITDLATEARKKQFGDLATDLRITLENLDKDVMGPADIKTINSVMGRGKEVQKSLSKAAEKNPVAFLMSKAPSKNADLAAAARLLGDEELIKLREELISKIKPPKEKIDTSKISDAITALSRAPYMGPVVRTAVSGAKHVGELPIKAAQSPHTWSEILKSQGRKFKQEEEK